ncbi:MAG: DUF4139 domain-containing protein [Rhodobacter sp.]|nr:DUF4139 domain-containing protein [Rhodobacter sp.]MCA3460458.1 DUF4139 domain-containing protein [Rhodobacter sp.]MCA3465884.1 DUF4139 domain-containing protein [Rhodobacter sp.]MCA3467376.1 DUF4139 domain-containing protein [Rhodobacter sp.]MCA3469213.1 DUF4139 domain-containing protein [Rhodobacter sp.]
MKGTPAMTPTLRLAAAACLFALPGFAQTLTAESKITSVTVYGNGAMVTRKVDLTLPPGVSEVIIPDLPTGSGFFDAESFFASLRINAPDGVAIVAISAAQDLPASLERQPGAALQAAQAEVDRLDAAARESAAAAEAIRLKAKAAQEQIAALRGIAQTTHGTQSIDDLRAPSQMVGTETLRALQTAHQAEQEAAAAELARSDDLKALERARASLAALTPDQEERYDLLLTLNSAGGPAVLEVTDFTSMVAWRPQYDFRLTTGETPKLMVDRRVLVIQQSGEDWNGVELILSANDLTESVSAGTLYERSQGIVEKRVPQEYADGEGGMAEPVMEPLVVEEQSVSNFSFDSVGLARLYRFPVPVSIRSTSSGGTLLSLNQMEFTPEVYALTVPIWRDLNDAYVTADFTNTSEEPLVAAMTRLFLDGSLVGVDSIDYVPAGGDATVGFGPVRGLQVTRSVTNKSQGETGLLSVSTQSNELVQIDLNNLTGRDWPVRLQDRVPFSEQDDLKISYTATPPATTENLNRQRGVLEWRFDLPDGQTRQVTLETRMQWPEGKELE